jgi:hypothetical protein
MANQTPPWQQKFTMCETSKLLAQHLDQNGISPLRTLFCRRLLNDEREARSFAC